MTYIKELPVCLARFGRTKMEEMGDCLVPRFIIACGYREVDPEECILCGGFTGTKTKIELKIDTYIITRRSAKAD